MYSSERRAKEMDATQKIFSANRIYGRIHMHHFLFITRKGRIHWNKIYTVIHSGSFFRLKIDERSLRRKKEKIKLLFHNSPLNPLSNLLSFHFSL